jgi:hypothetical protein
VIDHDRIPPDAKELREAEELLARWPMLRRSGWWAWMVESYKRGEPA